mmetsp:Transcript_31516/g.90775  ORF Transcript_31516/g.90775 Transcript_31516/m.90775 type:complete len:384 (+) Transcript_31516:760-1911(+)
MSSAKSRNSRRIRSIASPCAKTSPLTRPSPTSNASRRSSSSRRWRRSRSSAASTGTAPLRSSTAASSRAMTRCISERSMANDASSISAPCIATPSCLTSACSSKRPSDSSDRVVAPPALRNRPLEPANSSRSSATSRSWRSKSSSRSRSMADSRTLRSVCSEPCVDSKTCRRRAARCSETSAFLALSTAWPCCSRMSCSSMRDTRDKSASSNDDDSLGAASPATLVGLLRERPGMGIDSKVLCPGFRGGCDPTCWPPARCRGSSPSRALAALTGLEPHVGGPGRTATPPTVSMKARKETRPVSVGSKSRKSAAGSPSKPSRSSPAAKPSLVRWPTSLTSRTSKAERRLPQWLRRKFLKRTACSATAGSSTMALGEGAQIGRHF